MEIPAFFDIIVHPKEHMPKEVKKANTHEAMKTFAIVGAIIGFFIGLGITIFGSILGGAGGLGVLAVVVVPIVMAIVVVLGSIITSGLTWLFANFVGGKGTFEQNYYLSSRLVWPSIVVGILIGILSMIPLLGFLIQLAWAIYSVYLTIVLISVANKLTMGRAFIAWIIPVVIVLVLVALFVGAIIASVIAGAATGNI